ncbi:MAG: methionyl-tRNA formyltransferase [Mycoplasma sp.]
MKKTKVLFFGTDEISFSALKALIEQGYNIVGVVTRADTTKGRKQQVVFSPVKQLALAHKLNLFQPLKFTSEVVNEILATNPEVILTCSYGKIIPESIINFPKYKCINIHPSLLPKYRGASPIQAAVMNNDTVTGISFIYMTKELDNGPILCQETINCDLNETSSSLRIKVANLIPIMIHKYFASFLTNNVKSIKQDETKATYVGMIKREDEVIDWNKKASEINAFVRALMNEPIAYSIINNTPIKILKTEITNIKTNDFVPGTIINLNKNGIFVATHDFALVIKRLQLPGKKPIEVRDFINGNRLIKLKDTFNLKN